MPEIGPVELIIILVIVTMLFGVGRLPEVFGSVGRGVREFRQAMSSQDETPAPPTPEPASSQPVPLPESLPAPVEFVEPVVEVSAPKAAESPVEATVI